MNNTEDSMGTAMIDNRGGTDRTESDADIKSLFFSQLIPIFVENLKGIV